MIKSLPNAISNHIDILATTAVFPSHLPLSIISRRPSSPTHPSYKCVLLVFKPFGQNYFSIFLKFAARGWLSSSPRFYATAIILCSGVGKQRNSKSWCKCKNTCEMKNCLESGVRYGSSSRVYVHQLWSCEKPDLTPAKILPDWSQVVMCQTAPRTPSGGGDLRQGHVGFNAEQLYIFRRRPELFQVLFSHQKSSWSRFSCNRV